MEDSRTPGQVYRDGVASTRKTPVASYDYPSLALKVVAETLDSVYRTIMVSPDMEPEVGQLVGRLSSGAIEVEVNRLLPPHTAFAIDSNLLRRNQDA